MPWGGAPVGCMAGDVQDMILDVNARVFANDILAMTINPIGQARQRYWAIFVNGQWTGQNYFIGLDNRDILIPLNSGTSIGSLFIEDAGHWPTFDYLSYVPSARAMNADAITAKNILFKWSSNYTISAVEGDSQLAISSLTGALRGTNVGAIPGQHSRGRLTYSITSVGTTHIVRFWDTDDQTLVSEGSRIGNGVLTCNPSNNSGITVTATLTYTSDLSPNTALVDLRWPAQYQIFWSLSPIVSYASPNLTVNDNGKTDYVYQSTPLSNGSYYWTILEVDDEGVQQSSGIPAPANLIVNAAPNTPTITSVTGTAAALTVHWSGGTVGSNFTVYSSLINEPVNFGRFPFPLPITTAINATSQVLAPITGYAPVSMQPEIDILVAAFDTQVALMNAAFTAGETGFGAVVTTAMNTLISAAEVFAENVGGCAIGQKDSLAYAFNDVLHKEQFLSGLGLSTANWQNDMGIQFAPLLTFLGDILEHTPGRYTLPNGAIGAAALGSATIGTGPNFDGTSGLALGQITDSLVDIALPVIRNGYVRIVVRSTLGGVEETGDKQVVIELDGSGNIINPRPPVPNIVSSSVTKSGSNYIISVQAQVLTDNNATIPTTVNLFAAAPGSINLNNPPQGSAALPTPVGNSQLGTVTATVGSTGWIELQLTTQINSTQSFGSDPAFIYVAPNGTQAVSNIRAQVTRGRSNLNGPDS